MEATMRLKIFCSVVIFTLFLHSGFIAWAGELTDDALTTFEAGTPAVANDVNANFDAAQAEINDNNTRILDNASDISTNTADIESLTNAGLIAFCGNGSAGDKVVSSDENWVNNPPDDTSFNNLTINTGVNLTVAAGIVIRCTGNFINNGEIIVMECSGTYNESLGAPTGSDPSQVSSQSHPGDARSAATAGWFDNEGDTDPSNTYGGIGGKRIATYHLLSFNNVRMGGGSGAGYAAGACGGGLIKVYCKGSITNAGAIEAYGQSYAGQAAFGNGGGAGGIVILASMTSIDNSGYIEAVGGSGSSSFVDTDNNQYSHGPGGGGGGGIVILAAPSINPGMDNIDVSGGFSGSTPSGIATGYNRYGGGGGGGCGGNGGNGGYIDKFGNISIDLSAPNGEDGKIIVLNINPLNRIF
jgi:hypothetical protein